MRASRDCGKLGALTATRELLALLDPADNGWTLELFVAGLLEHDEDWTRFGRATDGVEYYRVVENLRTRLRLCGRLWEITKQTQHTFWLDVEREYESATEARWTLHFDLLDASPRFSRTAVDVLATPEDVAWRVTLSGRALIADHGVLVTSVDGDDDDSTKRVAHGAGIAQLAFELPRHGWLPYQLNLDDFELADDASNVLNDPVEELADCIDALVSGRAGPTRICLWSEPGGYALDVEAVSSLGVSITVWSHPNFVPPMKTRRMQQEWSGGFPREVVLGAFRAALLRWLEDMNDDALAHWNRNAAEYRRRLSRCLKPTS